MKTYNVWGHIRFDVDIDIEADSEESATKKAKEMIDGMYHVNCYGAYHNPRQVDYNINADELEEHEIIKNIQP